tara:strand:+ start:3379 stop:4236 length:858 start_codon:yes stop_codon:yes gene_type:complete
MRKVVLLFLILAIFTSLNFVIAADCDLSVSLINQDPYPGIPGEYVKIVFQIEGVENPSCEGAKFEVIERYPFSLDPGENSKIELTGGTYVSDYRTYLTVPYRVRIDEDALDGENEIEIFLSSGVSDYLFRKLFNITIGDSRSNFEVFVEDYNYNTKIITFEILNIGENDVEALTVEIPKQSNIETKGNNFNIVGSLDKNEDTTFTYEAIPQDGEISLVIYYNDNVDVRRSLEKTIYFDSSFFIDRKRDERTTPTFLYVILITISLILFFWFIKKRNNKKKGNKPY